ncbi:hypothetical protein U9M48_028229 [Paspalum notatum var. saurae]|uniref:Uncharacterized protein n=1 Tax=Paspalum notatum var. saurae TaxID=547442 RepID=A0AAQ3U0W1_PASNO
MVRGEWPPSSRRVLAAHIPLDQEDAGITLSIIKTAGHEAEWFGPSLVEVVGSSTALSGASSILMLAMGDFQVWTAGTSSPWLSRERLCGLARRHPLRRGNSILPLKQPSQEQVGPALLFVVVVGRPSTCSHGPYELCGRYFKENSFEYECSCQIQVSNFNCVTFDCSVFLSEKIGSYPKKQCLPLPQQGYMHLGTAIAAASQYHLL